MEEMKGFFDLCLSESCVKENFENTARQIREMGYQTVAINQVVEEANLETKKKKKKGEVREIGDIVPSPVELPPNIRKGQGHVRFLHRLTIAFSNQDVIHKIIKSPNYKRYDLIAVLPLTQAALQFTCNNIEADILTFDSESRATYKISRKLYNQLLEKGYHFEIQYAPAIQDSTQRKNIIQVAHTYHSIGKSKNIIVSSGATNALLIRNPYDVINLGFIFGLSEEQAKNAITHHARRVYINSVGRRYGRPVAFFKGLEIGERNEKSQETDDEMEVDQPAQKKTKQ